LVDPKTTRLVGKTKFEDEIEKKMKLTKKTFQLKFLSGSDLKLNRVRIIQT
jgi:hypothetical protein